MKISSEIYEILGILTYLDYPKYLRQTNIKCVTDIFDKIEEEIEDLEVQVEELEKYYNLIKDQNDKDILLYKINEKKQEITDMQNQLNFIK
jgi:chromosome segregation ATPase